MDSSIVTILVSLIAACGGAWGVVEAALKRKWMKEDKSDTILEKLNIMETNNKEMIADVKESTDRSINNLREILNNHIAEQERQSAITSRNRIVRVADEIRSGKQIGEEVLKSTLEEITFYNAYCNDNPNFKNSIAELSISLIQDMYKTIKQVNNNE